MTKVTFKRKHLTGLLVSDSQRPQWHIKSLAAGTAESSYLDLEVGCTEKTHTKMSHV